MYVYMYIYTYVAIYISRYINRVHLNPNPAAFFKVLSWLERKTLALSVHLTANAASELSTKAKAAALSQFDTEGQVLYEQAPVSLKLKKSVDAEGGRTFAVIIEGG